MNIYNKLFNIPTYVLVFLYDYNISFYNFHEAPKISLLYDV